MGQRSGEDVWQEIQFESRALMESGEPILTLGREIPSVITGVTDSAIQRLSEDSKTDAGSEISKGTILKIWDELASTGISEYSGPFRIAWAFVARMIDGVEYRPNPFRIVIVDEEAAMRPFTVAPEARHLVVRWSFERDPETVALHRSVADEHGETWWRQLGSRAVLGTANISALQTQIAAGVETFAFICRSGEVWRTTLRQIEPGTFTPPAEKVPPGEGTSENTKLWLLLADWQPLPDDWPLRNLVFALGDSRGKPINFNGQTSVNVVHLRREQTANVEDGSVAVLIREILALQPQYATKDSPAMADRQSLVGQVATACKAWVDELNDERKADEPVLEVEHGGMAGSYAVIPWIRIFSNDQSPSATKGTYLVFLFSADGERCYLSINQGTSEFRANRWRAVREIDEMAERAATARNALPANPSFLDVIDLGRVAAAELTKSTAPLERMEAYEASNVRAAQYTGDDFDDDQIRTDLRSLVGDLMTIYGTSEPVGPAPDPPPPFGVGLINALVDEAGLLLAPEVVPAIVAAIESGKHVILTGPPGTAKTTLAETVARAAQQAGRCAAPRLTTATSDWTTFETVGGLRPDADGALAFAPGQFLAAIRANDWLIIDELNRSNFDRAFGQLFTVLAGEEVELPYTDASTGQPIVIALGTTESPGSERFEIATSWRIIATMNVFDKSLLFEMSFALMRRFCFIEVAAPTDDQYRTLIRREANGDEQLAGLLDSMITPLLKLRTIKELGPALFIDIARFCRERLAIGSISARALRFQVFYSYLLPQFEGISDLDGRTLFKRVKQMVRKKDVEPLRQSLHDVLGIQVGRAPGEDVVDDDEDSDEEDVDDRDEPSTTATDDDELEEAPA